MVASLGYRRIQRTVMVSVFNFSSFQYCSLNVRIYNETRKQSFTFLITAQIARSEFCLSLIIFRLPSLSLRRKFLIQTCDLSLTRHPTTGLDESEGPFSLCYCRFGTLTQTCFSYSFTNPRLPQSYAKPNCSFSKKTKCINRNDLWTYG